MSLGNGIWHGPNIGDSSSSRRGPHPTANSVSWTRRAWTLPSCRSPRSRSTSSSCRWSRSRRWPRETDIGLAEYCAVHPDRLRWMAHAPLGYPDAAARILKEAADLGHAGVQVAPLGGRPAAGRCRPRSLLGDGSAATGSRSSSTRATSCRSQPFADFSLGAIIGLPGRDDHRAGAARAPVASNHYPSLHVVGARRGGFFPYNIRRLRNYIRCGVACGSCPPTRGHTSGGSSSTASCMTSTRCGPGPEGWRREHRDRPDCSFSSAPVAPVDECPPPSR